MLTPKEQELEAPGRRLAVALGGVLGAVVLAACVFGSLPVRTGRLQDESLDAPYEALKPLHEPKRAPRKGEWLAEHKEPGQSLSAYKASFHIAPTAEQRTLYLQRIGDFTPAQERALTLTAEYLERFFGLPVKSLEPLPSSVIPAKARRNNPSTGQPQVLSSYVLNEVLAPRRPADGVVVLAFTAEDLWPGHGWNFVFGQAALLDRVGVWSIYRYGDPSESDEAFRLFLRRTINTAVHETGHMFSLPHCIAYECVMNGSNSQEESDAQPPDPCPVCLNKLGWNLGFEPVARYQRLLEFSTREHLTEHSEHFQRALQVLRAEKR
jgi:archaemetzincin